MKWKMKSFNFSPQFSQSNETFFNKRVRRSTFYETVVPLMKTDVCMNWNKCDELRERCWLGSGGKTGLLRSDGVLFAADAWSNRLSCSWKEPSKSRVLLDQNSTVDPQSICRREKCAGKNLPLLSRLKFCQSVMQQKINAFSSVAHLEAVILAAWVKFSLAMHSCVRPLIFMKRIRWFSEVESSVAIGWRTIRTGSRVRVYNECMSANFVPHRLVYFRRTFLPQNQISKEGVHLIHEQILFEIQKEKQDGSEELLEA